MIVVNHDQLDDVHGVGMIVDNAVCSFEARRRGYVIAWNDSAETVVVDRRIIRDSVVKAVSVTVEPSEI